MNTTRRVIWAMVILIALWIIIYAIGNTPLAKAPQTPSIAPPERTIDLADAAYNIEGINYALNNGVATIAHASSSSQDILRLYQTTRGDIKGTGEKDGAAILINETGGSAVFYYIAAIFADGNATPAVLLGDRIETESIAIHDGAIVVHYKDRTASQPFSKAPTVEEVATFTVVNGMLARQ